MGQERRSIASFSPEAASRGAAASAARDGSRRNSCAGSTSTSSACRRRRRKWTRSSPSKSAGRLREARRPAARVAALRRALGAALARPRSATPRADGYRMRRLPAERLALPRLRHPRVQQRQAVRPLRAASNSPATSSRPSDPDALIATGFLRALASTSTTSRDVGTQVERRSSTTSPTRPATCSSGWACSAPAATTTSSTRSCRRTTTASQAFFAPVLPRDDLDAGDAGRAGRARKEARRRGRRRRPTSGRSSTRSRSASAEKAAEDAMPSKFPDGHPGDTSASRPRSAHARNINSRSWPTGR